MPPRWRVSPRSWPGTSGPDLNGQRITSWTGCSRSRPGLHLKAAGMTAPARKILPPGCARLGHCVMRDQRSAKRHQTNSPPRRAWPPACAPDRRRWTMTKSPPGGRRSGRPGGGEGTYGRGSRATACQRAGARTRGGSSARKGARARVVMPIPAELILTPVLEPKSCAFRRAAYCPS